MTGLILDIVIAILLVTTILYCWRLSRKMSIIKQGKDELANILKQFDVSVSKAERTLNELRTAGQDQGELLQEQIEKARFLSNDLAFLLDKGEHVADNLEMQITSSRPITSGNNQPAEPRRRPPKNSMIGNPSTGQTAQSSSAQSPLSASKKRVLDDVLQQIAERKRQANAPKQEKATIIPPATSERVN